MYFIIVSPFFYASYKLLLSDIWLKQKYMRREEFWTYKMGRN